MKQETKELIDWIKESIQAVEHEKAEMFSSVREKVNKAIAFLDSIPEIESHLCMGGYIQDRNGTPCCNEDKVIINNSYTGTLKWDSSLFKFLAEVHKDGEEYPYRIEILKDIIEKAEQ